MFDFYHHNNLFNNKYILVILLLVILISLLLLINFIWKNCVLEDDSGLTSVKEGIYDVHPDNKVKSIRILGNMNSPGTKYDMNIYNKLLPNSYISHYSESNNKNYDKLITRDVNIHFEKIYNLDNAKKHYFVINQEFFYEPLDKLQQIDKFFCKSRYAQNLLLKFTKKYKLSGQVVYIGHTSIDSNKDNDIKLIQPKNKNMFVHLAGKSPFKNTSMVINVWKRIHKKYPDCVLIVTCRGNCKKFLKCEMCNLENDGIIYKEFFDDMDFVKNSICYICPSLVEGFGHYINEGRANGCAIITTDGSPMNELVINNKNGVLVNVDHKTHSEQVVYPYRKYFPFIKSFENIITQKKDFDDSEAFFVSENDLYNSIESFILLSDSEKLKMCNNSRLMYVEDQEKFENNLNINI